MEVDVIVVGAGPAGTTAARELAARGRSVLILDRAEFPRDKPCGGGLSVAATASLPFDIGSVVEREVSGLLIGDPRTGVIERDLGATFLYMTQRDRLDALLLHHAMETGAAFSSGQLVTHVAERPDRTFEVTVRSDGGGEATHHARVVIGADGANGVVRRALGFAAPEETAVALEGRLPCPDGIPTWLDHRIALSPGLVLGGYGWLFPKADHINIGVGGWKPAGPMLHTALEAYMRAYGWDIADLEGVEGHLLPLRGRRVALARGGAALIGDAAGLVDPVTGGGIANAIASANMLAPAAEDYLAGVRDDLSEYQRAIEAEMYPALERSRSLAELFYAAPDALMALARHSDRTLDAAVEAVRDAAGAAIRPARSTTPSLLTSALWSAAAAGSAVARQVSVWRYGRR